MSAICSLCGSGMTVQDGEGTAFCLACENAGLHKQLVEAEAKIRRLSEVELDLLNKLESEGYRLERLHARIAELEAALKEILVHPITYMTIAAGALKGGDA